MAHPRSLITLWPVLAFLVFIYTYTSQAQYPPNYVWCEYEQVNDTLPFTFIQPIWWMEYFSFNATQNETVMFKAYSGILSDASIQMIVGTNYCPTFVNVKFTNNTEYQYPACPNSYNFGTTNVTMDVVAGEQYIIFVHMSGGNYTILGCENSCPIVCPNDCSNGNGICNLETKKCTCNPQWMGESCSEPNVPVTGATFNTTCDGEGCVIESECPTNKAFTNCLVNITCSYEEVNVTLNNVTTPESVQVCSPEIVCFSTEVLPCAATCNATCTAKCDKHMTCDPECSSTCNATCVGGYDMAGQPSCTATCTSECDAADNATCVPSCDAACTVTNSPREVLEGNATAHCTGTMCTVSSLCQEMLCQTTMNVTCNDTECTNNQTCVSAAKHHRKVPFGNAAIFYTIVIAVPSILLLSGVGGVGLVALHRRGVAKRAQNGDAIAKQPLLTQEDLAPDSPVSPPPDGIRRRANGAPGSPPLGPYVAPAGSYGAHGGSYSPQGGAYAAPAGPYVAPAGPYVAPAGPFRAHSGSFGSVNGSPYVPFRGSNGLRSSSGGVNEIHEDSNGGARNGNGNGNGRVNHMYDDED